VQRAEDDMPRLGRLDGGVDRFQVAHLADQDHVGAHAQRPADALLEARAVHAHLVLSTAEDGGRLVAYSKSRSKVFGSGFKVVLKPDVPTAA
jgi:hypothetical protein